MSTTTRHLTEIGHAAQSGAHIVLLGEIGDEVLWDGDVCTEQWGIERGLEEHAGIEAVAVVDAANGLTCPEDEPRKRLASLLADATEDPNRPVQGNRPALGARGALEIVNAIRVLLEQRETPVAVVVRQFELLFDTMTDQGRRALGILREALGDANTVERPGFAPPRNCVLFVGGGNGSAAFEHIAGTPGLRELRAGRPTLIERRAALESLRAGFYREGEEEPASDADLDTIARATHGWSLRRLEQLRRRSHSVEMSACRPQSLLRRAGGREMLSPIGVAGVDYIMEALDRRLFGQDKAMETVREILARGARRSFSREPGTRSQAPMARFVLAGPPGVGKTEFCYVLAEALTGTQDSLHRIDCGTWTGSQDGARIVGPPPGYIGHGSETLVDVVSNGPCVLLFDEYHLAPESLRDILISILDSGSFQDGRNRSASFEDVAIVLTMNRGTDELASFIRAERPDTETLLDESSRIVKRVLSTESSEGGCGSPAFWSRVSDAVVGFDMLRRTALPAIFAQRAGNIEANLSDELGVHLPVDSAAFTEIASSWLPEDGDWDGREVNREIKRLIEDPLSIELDGNGIPAGPVRVVPGPDGLAVIEPALRPVTKRRRNRE